jgi:hypothetical protein
MLNAAQAKCRIWLQIGLGTGDPRVGISQPVPVPAITVPVAGTGTHRTRLAAVLYDTRGILGTRGFVLLQSHCNLTKAARTRQLTWRRIS